MRRLALLLCAPLLCACPAQPLPMDAPDLAAPPPPPVLKRPSRSSSIVLAEDDSLLAMVLPEEGTLLTVNPQGLGIVGRARTGAGPAAVVLHPDRRTAFVANRADATVVRVQDADTTAPRVSEPVLVGAEPTGLALTPTGATLFVAEFGEGRITAIDTASMRVVGTITGLSAPRALLVTNNGDSTDADETLVVTEFYGEAPPDGSGEGVGTGRTGRLRLYSVADYGERGSIALQPLSADEAGFGAPAAPNQLGAIAVSGSRVYVTGTAVSPEPPLWPERNVNPVLHVADLRTKAEVRGPVGTFSLAAKIAASADTPRTFLGDLADVDFAPQSGVAYLVSRGADAVQRVIFADDGSGVRVGGSTSLQIDLDPVGCAGPTGIAVSGTSPRAFVNCWLSRSLTVVDLAKQAPGDAIAASESLGPEDAVSRGRRAFYSARGRFAKDGWSSCASCHPDGLSDNITWIFPTGPRQSSSLDGAYSRGGMTPRPRAFGWTATFDEVHDFEAVLRGVSGGAGAITTASGQCGDLLVETPVELAPTALGAPTSREAQEGPGRRCSHAFDDIEAFLKALRPPRGRRVTDTASVRRGAALFGAGGCVKCHGGPGWSVSRLAYEPTSAAVTQLAGTLPFSRPAAWPASWTFQATYQIAPQPTAAEVAGYNGAPIGPPQLACAVRNVGTFGVPGDAARTDALERKAEGGRALGRGGYAVPALYGLAVSAPYLHHGQAPTLQALFSEARFRAHTEAGAAGFLQGAEAARDRDDLVNFLLSIDASMTEQSVPAGYDAGCVAP